MCWRHDFQVASKEVQRLPENISFNVVETVSLLPRFKTWLR
ncbi:hypothetical protein EIKCOROL_00053 [Eikenella corrodens ATCC 23834]|uniref:Uncharacterized protein n=1 Tax=Eikenella corrodens ATCC 23834 TaxID=546274 RepID=C0DRT7_EIKCO|nr:hypothetical protein EIKCOROL_00053 [Eikenella corrodens ATCC 23834]